MASLQRIDFSSTEIIKSTFSEIDCFSIVTLLDEIISNADPTLIPPVNDSTPHFYYVVPASDTSRS